MNFKTENHRIRKGEETARTREREGKRERSIERVKGRKRKEEKYERVRERESKKNTR